MSETEKVGHTPGPWYFEAENGKCHPRVYGADNALVAKVGNAVLTRWEEWDPNARLIAAAPTMAAEIDDLKSANKLLHSLVSNRDAELSRLREQNAEMAEALSKIERWFGEFPDTGEKWQDGTPVSYGAQYGSNGERDYMRGIAHAALSSARSASASEWDDLRGAAPDATGNLSSEDFVRKLRDEWPGSAEGEGA